MKTIEIIRNSVMQCIERIAKLTKSVEKVDNSMKLQEQNIENGKIYDSVMSNFVSSQFENFTYMYYTENGEIKSILFNDGNVNEPNVPNYTISGKPVSYRCHNQTSKVVFKDFDTSAVTNMSSMFYGCRLTTLDLSGFNTSAVTDMSSMFEECRNLTTLDLSGFDTSAVTNMSSMFSSCSKLKTLDLSSFDTSAVTNMSSMFEGCQNFTTLDLSSFNTSSVTKMGSMFGYCINLTTLDLSGFNTSAVTDMSSMFEECRNLTTLDLSGFDTSAVTNMGSMFYGCNFTTLDLSSFNTSSVTNMSEMFIACSNLTTLDLSSFDTSAVTNMGFMFQECYNLTTIIGTHTLEEVQAGTVKALRGLKISISFSYSPNLERASILALFYGLADLTGKTKKTIILHDTAKERLTAEDIKIATDKNWNV